MTPTLVLLPGMDGSGRLFGRFRECLRGRFPISAVAYPTDRCSARPELHRMLEAALPADGDYVLVAESYSGTLAIEHAATRPRQLRAVVLVASFAASPLPRGLRWLHRFAGAARIHLPGFLVRFLLVGGRAPSDLVREVRAAVGSVRPEVLVDRLRQVFTVDVRAQLPSIAVPVLYLRGRTDRLVGSRGLGQCRGQVGQLAVEVVDGPHLLLQARPSESAEAITRFLSGETRSDAHQRAPRS